MTPTPRPPILGGMGRPPDAVTDPARLATLRALALLDGHPTAALQRVASLTARVLGTPLVMLILIDERRQFCAAQHGPAEP